MPRFMRVIAALALLKYVCSAETSWGAPECPCITNSSAHFATLQAELVAAGSSALFGTQGCKAYDANDPEMGCASNEAAYCLSQWCYIDAEMCAYDKGRCEAEGGKTGSDTSPYCRSRPSVASHFISRSYQYSYETCGNLNNYDSSVHQNHVAGIVIKAAIQPLKPWVVKYRDAFGKEKYGGPHYDLFMDALKVFKPRPIVQLAGWATKQSKDELKARYNDSSDYTACVHDVAIGNFDVCIADTWFFPGRAKLTAFTPPLRQDLFYLVTRKTKEELGFRTYLKKPFAPFTAPAWGVIAAFLFFMSVLLVLMKLLADDCRACEHGCRSFCRKALKGLRNTTFFIWYSLLSSSSSVEEGQTGFANMLFQFSFAFFILVTVVTYTATLKSLLIVQHQASGSVTDIDSAIEKGMKICVYSTLKATVEAVYPTGMFVPIGWEKDAREIYAGKCEASLMSEDVLRRLHAGVQKEQDCKEQHAHCKRDDCDLIRVGDHVHSIPIAFPISSKLLHALSWSITGRTATGQFEQLSRLNQKHFPRSKCKARERTEHDRLGVEDLSGTIMISTFAACLGVVYLALKLLRQARCSARLPSAAMEDTTSAVETGYKYEEQAKAVNNIQGLAVMVAQMMSRLDSRQELWREKHDEHKDVTSDCDVMSDMAENCASMHDVAENNGQPLNFDASGKEQT